VILDVLMLSAVGLVLARWLFLLVAAAIRGNTEALPATTPPPITVVIPAYNEELVLEQTVLGVLASSNVDLRVLLIDDGSIDGTGEIAERLATEHPQVQAIIFARNGGKPAALNAGFHAARTELVASLDADTVPAPEALARLAAHLVDPGMAAAASNVKVGNRGSWLTRWQSIEYISAIHLNRRALALFNTITTVPGALAMWRRAPVLQSGGFSSQTLSEDTDLTLTLTRAGYRVGFVDRAIAHTQAPLTTECLFRQRKRWLYGNLQCLWKHRGGFVDGPWALRLLGLPNLLYTHLLVYLLLPLSALYLVHAPAHFSLTELLLLGAALFSLDWFSSAFAYLVDKEALGELLEVPLQRFIFPFLLWGVFASVLTAFLRQQNMPWLRVERRSIDAFPAHMQ
jgi:cellulose synthase/poly-beta-1,6-N-acetylglucosamine synthase-like glycosyltransferase